MSARVPLAVRCLRHALPTTGNGVRLLPRQCPRPGGGLRRPVRCVHRNAPRSWRISTEKDSRIARQPLFMRRCSMKGSITARSAPCIACSNSETNHANAATSSRIRRTRSRSCWPPRPISCGAGTSPNCWGPPSGPTSTSTSSSMSSAATSPAGWSRCGRAPNWPSD